MASISFGCGDEIDYSINDGHVRRFVIGGQTLLDERAGITVEGWRDVLIELIQDTGLDQDRDGCGLHAFVMALVKDGHMEAPHGD